MYHRNYTTYLQKELDFLKLLVSRFHEQEKVNGLELDVALLKTQEIYDQLLRIRLAPDSITGEKTELPPQPVASKTVVIHEGPKKTEPFPPPLPPPLPPPFPPPFPPISETPAQPITGGDLSKKLQTAPLNTIVAGIGLNDKFLYVRELFKGNNDLYNEAVRILDKTDSLEKALDYIHHHFEWDENNEIVQKFMSLVHRRHGAA